MSDATARLSAWWEEGFDPSVILARRFLDAERLYADRPAILTHSGDWISHAEIHAHAHAIRDAIRRASPGHGLAVASLTTTPEGMTSSVLASLTAARRSVFLDPTQPATRNRAALRQAQVGILLADDASLEHAQALAEDDTRLIAIDTLRGGLPAADRSDLHTEPTANDGELVIFTSGSTGVPKGVIRSHRSMLHSAYNITKRYAIHSDHTMLYVGSPGHVGTLNDTLLHILNGHRALPIRPDRINVAEVLEFIEAHAVTHAALPPSLLRLVLKQALTTRRIARAITVGSSGEALLRSDVGLFFQATPPGSVLWQSYGSTECGHMCAGFYTERDAPGSGPLALNTPAEGADIEILDPDGKPSDVGQTGEVRVRTPALTTGYLTEDGTITAPPQLTHDTRGPYFLTGDRATRIDARTFVIEGRADRQINRHGQRLELGDIESAILARPAWGEAAAALIETDTGRSILMALVSARPEATETIGTLRAELGKTLPAHAIPARIIQVEALPRTPTAKIDPTAVRTQLLESLTRTHREPAHETPVGPSENWIADAWQSVLSLSERPSRLARFDESGGDSLDAVRLGMLLTEKFGCETGIDFVARHRTIAEQADAIQDAPNHREPRVVPLRTADSEPVFVMVPGAGGHAWVYLPVADALPTDTNLLALSLDGSDPHLLTPNALASLVVRRLDSAGINGPLIVGGYSLGALVAAHLADACDRLGRPASRIAMIDPRPLRQTPLLGRLARSMRAKARFRGNQSSNARRMLDAQINATRNAVASLYRPGMIRLGDTPCAVIGTTGTIKELQTTGMLFGRGVDTIDLTEAGALGHLDLMRHAGASTIAEWMARQIAAVSHEKTRDVRVRGS